VEHQSLSQTVVPPEVLRATLESPTEITKIEPFGAERTARVVVHVTHPTRFQVGSLKSTEDKAPRLFVDIEHASFRGQEVIESKGLVQRVRLGKKDGSTRVVLDLSKEAHHRVFYLPDPFRLVIDLSLDELEQSENLRQIRRVVLDPGHGGHDPGAVGPNGLREKDVALDIAHRAAPLLAREVGVSTLLTRDVDAFVPLDERAARANAFHADLFVSIHLNSSEDKDSNGVMTFVLDTSKDAAASKIAARENSSTEAAAAELANSLSRIQSESRRAASETFAKLLQRSAGASLRENYRGVSDHGVRSAGFYVLAGASMPAVLFEGSFISNSLEAQRLNSEDYRQRLADAVVNAVRAYRDGL
jgi:N-acetylmuramoyl-L-alanine amidase